MAHYTAGSVDAKVILDTEEFNEAIGKLKEEVKELKTSFNKVKGAGLTEEIEKLKKEMDSLKRTNENYRKTIDNLRKSLKNKSKDVKDAINDENRYNEAVVKVDRSTQNLKKSTDELNNSTKKLGDKGSIGRNLLDPNAVRSTTEEIERLLNVVNKAAVQLGKETGHNKTWTMAEDMRGQFYSLHTQLKSLLPDSTSLAQAMENVEERVISAVYAHGQFFRLLPSGYKSAQEAAERYRQRVGAIADELKAKWHSMTAELAKANAAQYKYWKQVRGTADVEGYNNLKPLQFSYNDYLQQDINKMNEALAKYEKEVQTGARTTLEFKETLVQLAEAVKTTNSQVNRFEGSVDKVVASMSRMGKSNEIAAELRKIGMELNHFSSLSTVNKHSLAALSEQTVILKDKFQVLETAFKKGEITAETYDAELTKLAEKLKLLGSSAQQSIRELTGANAEMSKTSANARNLGRGITSFNNGIVQTAHSGRILSNTLYQIRGALLSLKMIFTAMGGMMLWGFAMDIAESVKETVTAKNEMEAQLKQNTKVDTQGIQYFRKELDKLPKTFQKVNKYTVGETVSSIGLEFNLTAKQMKDALPIVTMIQSEYVRAGRKTSEAALAVKDILQGEFQRLSRETGVGKEELVAYGWDEDKTNIDGLLKALNKAALDRHWDVFAKKATSLNDVIEITKSRFSEFGADLVDSITPLIVGGFNTIIDVIEGLQKAFNGLGSFGQNFALFGGGTALFGGILTALPMVTKGMGLAEIATLGWKKSIATAVLNLNKAEVGVHGFRKALAATISGTTAAELSETRWSKAIMGRLLGVNQSILAERGYKSAIFNSSMALREGIDLNKTSVNLGKASILNLETMTTKEMGRAQKMAYLTNNIKLNEAAELSRGKAILKTVTSARVLRTVLLGLTGIGLVTWLASTAAWTDAVKKRFEKYNEVLQEGKDKIKSYEDDVDTYTNNLAKQKDELAGLTEGTDKYNKKLKEIELTNKNLETSKHNVADMTMAYNLAKDIQKTNKQTVKDNDLMIGRGLESIYSDNGVKNVEKYGKEYQQMKYLAYDVQKSEEERYKFLYASQQHIKEHVDAMKEAGIAEKDRIKYITEYNTKAEEAAQHLKEFNQGDMTAGAYYLLDRLTLAWIDMWNDKDFINFWNTVKKTFEDLKPTLIAIKDTIIDLGRNLIKFFSTDSGRWVGVIALAAGAFGILAWKLKDVFGKAKDAAGGLKKVWKWLKKVGDKTGETKDVPDSDTSTTTEGTLGGGVEKGKLRETMGNQLRGDAVKYARAAAAIAAGMLLITEAIVLLRMPMAALAEQGWQFKQWEPEIKKGIEGLKLIAPTVAALLVPTVALAYLFGKFDIEVSTILKGSGRAAVGIAAGLLLVAETIFMLNAPLLAIASLGAFANYLGDNVKKGTETMKVVADSLQYLAPFIAPVAIGIALVAAAFAAPEFGVLAFGAVALGIPLGMTLLAETILSLNVPLLSIASLGATFGDLSGVKKGAEAIKAVADALVHVEEAVRLMALVEWDLLAGNIAQIINSMMGVNLTDLTEEGGFLDQLKQFVEGFSKYELEIPEGFEDKVTALKTAGESVGAIGDAMLLAKQAMDNLPDEFKKGGASLTYDMETDTTSIKQDNTVQSYFDTFKEPIKQLKQFVDDFNNSDEFAIEPVDTGRVENINAAANMITQINTAVENVKTAMANVGSAGHETAFAEGGMISALGFDLFHMTGAGAINNGSSSGSYKSSLGSSLQAMEDIISDMFTFQTNISQYGSDGSETTDVSALANMVTVVQQAISNLAQTLSDSVPQIKENGKSLGSAIVNGFKEGITGLESIGSGIPAKIANNIMNNKETLYATATSLGKTAATKFKDGVNPMSEYMTWELSYVKSAMTDRKEELGQTAYDLGSYIAQKFKEGDDINSPGIMARSMEDEVGYIGQYLTTNNLPQMAYDLGNLLSSNFKLDFNLGNFQFPDMSQWTSQLSTVIPTVDGIKTQVSTNFDTMKTNVQNSFSGIVSKTQTSMSSMKVATIGHIGSIKSSWRGMQDALIASAENIKSQTGQKINNLKTNMADFWRKIQNPSALIGGAAAGPTGTRPRRYGGQSRLKGLYAGNTPTSIKAPDISKDLKEYLRCMMETGGNCFAGGWSFDWNKPIQDKFNNWNTHFGKYKIDDHVKVGKFYNNSFPVKGIAEIAKAYIYDTIAATSYSKYFNSKFGEDPVAALKAGAFNCWDGTNIVLAIARAFGFEGSRGSGTWSGIGHVWANIPGLGIIDPTAIQGGYGFTSPKVKGYHAGGTISRSASAGDVPVGNTTNHNEEVHIHIHGDVYGVDDLDARIDEGANRVARKLFRNSYSGV